MKLPSTTSIFIIVLSLLAVALGYNYVAKPFAGFNQAAQAPTDSGPSPTPATTSVADLDSFTTDEKISQLLAVPLSLSLESRDVQPPTASPSSGSTSQPFTVATTISFQPGLVTLFGSKVSFDTAQEAIGELDAQIQIHGSKPLILVDHEGGTVQRLSGEGFTTLPSWQSLCGEDPLKRQELLRGSASELQQVGIDIVLAPVVDLASKSSVLKSRTCSQDRAVVSERAQEFMTAFSAYNILPVIKHFPGIGSVPVDLHQRSGTVQLTADDVLIFKDLLDKIPVLGLMTTHVRVAGQFEGKPCSLAAECAGNFQVEYPTVLVFADGLEMKAAGVNIQDANTPLTLSARAEQALLAGNDVLLFGPSVTVTELEQVKADLVKAYEANSQLRQRVNDSVTKVLTYKQQHERQ